MVHITRHQVALAVSYSQSHFKSRIIASPTTSLDMLEKKLMQERQNAEECGFGMGCTNRIWVFPGVSPLMCCHIALLVATELAKATLKMTNSRNYARKKELMYQNAERCGYGKIRNVNLKVQH